MDFGQSRQKKVQIDTRQLDMDKLKHNKPILSSPYSLTPRAEAFQEKYKEHIGYSVQADQANSIQLGVNTLEVKEAIGCLGFVNLDEDMAEHLLPDDNKLSLLILTLTDCPAISGTGYLMMKPPACLISVLCNKWLLILTLRQMEERMLQDNSSFLTGSGQPFGHEFFMPFSLNMANEKLEAILKTHPGTYLVKSAVRTDASGQLQQMVRIRDTRVQEDLLNFLRKSQSFQGMECSQVILQEYIERPLLVDKRKFTIRVYLLVVNPKRAASGDARPWQSGHFVLYHPGFVRLASAPYDPGHAKQCCQGDQDLSNQLMETTTWYPDELNLYLNRKRSTRQVDWIKDALYPRIGACLGYLAAVLRSCLDDRDVPTSTFRLLGADYLVGADLRLHLLDLDESPTWRRRTSVLDRVLPDLWREAVCLTSEIVIRYKTRRTICDGCLVTRQNFRMVYSSEDPGLARRNVNLLFE